MVSSKFTGFSDPLYRAVLGKGGCMKMLNRGGFADVIYRWSPEAESNECSDATTAQKESKRGKGGGGGTLGRDGLSNDASYHRCIGTPKIIACRPYLSAVNASS